MFITLAAPWANLGSPSPAAGGCPPSSSRATSIESKAGNTLPHRSSTTTLSREADTTGVAMFPRNRVRTS